MKGKTWFGDVRGCSVPSPYFQQDKEFDPCHSSCVFGVFGDFQFFPEVGEFVIESRVKGPLVWFLPLSVEHEGVVGVLFFGIFER